LKGYIRDAAAMAAVPYRVTLNLGFIDLPAAAKKLGTH
jgi:hypothetical protein